MKALAWLTMLAVATGSLVAQDSPAPAQDTSPTVVAAAWCPIKGKGTDDAVGCDVGAGLALVRRGRLSAVAVLGANSVGAGIAWVAHREAGRPVIAVALGVMAPYDSSGVSTAFRPALGVTLSFRDGLR